jgi:alpha-1,3-rhamnosyl/mannosyltransferase
MNCFHGVFQASLSANHIVAISQYTRTHFVRTFPHVDPQRVSVVYPASRFDGPLPIDRPDSLARLRPGEFWLSVGTLEPRKNHKRVLEAYARLRNDDTAPLIPSSSPEQTDG